MIRRCAIVVLICLALLVTAQPIDQSTNPAIDQSINPPVDVPGNGPPSEIADHPTNQPINQQIDQPSKKPSDQSTNQSTNQGFRYKFLPVDSYTFETIALVVLVVFFVNLSIGRSTNQSIATRVFVSLVDRFSAHFAVIGSYGQSIPHDCLKTLKLTNHSTDQSTDRPINQSIQYYKASLNEFSLSFTGRSNVDLMVISLETVKRHDLISLTLSQVDLSAKNDHLLIECVLSKISPVIFAIVRKKFEKRMRKNVRDLELFTHSIKSAKLSSSLAVMGENDDVIDQLIDQSFVKLMNDFDKWVILLHVSDQAVPTPGTTNSQMISLKLELPKTIDDAALQTINQFVQCVLQLSDRLSSYQLSAAALAKAQDLRRRAADAEAKKAKEEKKEAPKIKKEKDSKKPKMKVKAMRG